MYPLIEDANVQGYAGLLCYHQWKKIEFENSQRTLARIYFENAQKHLKNSLNVNSSSMFEYYYNDLIKQEYSGMERLQDLEKSLKERPNDINVCR